MHFAAGYGHLETVRALLDAGGDVHGFGDVHELDVIGWASAGRPLGDIPSVVLALLLERGAHHHIFSAIAIGDLDLIQNLVEQHPETLDRRMSRFEQGQTPLHFAISRNRYDVLDLLIGLGADLEARDKNGQSALEVAMLRGHREAISRLLTAGATEPTVADTSTFRTDMAQMAGSIGKGVPAINVPDIAATLDWYTSIGFTEMGRYEDDGVVNWGMVSFGKAELMFGMHGKPGHHEASLWFYTDRIDSLYQLFKSRQFEAVKGGHAGIGFVEELYEPFYGGKEFGIRDLNGYALYFLQPAATAPPKNSSGLPAGNT